MLALLFEVTPKPGADQRYLDFAARLRPDLEKHDGFLFIERYRSLARPQTILSHSLWRDEASLAAWRTYEPHHHAQVAGREKIFSDYRLRIAHVLRVRAPGKPEWISERRSSYNDPQARAPRFVVIAIGSSAGPVGKASESFESLVTPGSFITLWEGTDLDAASALAPATATSRICEVERDYGMQDRREAPQYYPPVHR
jgi:heme-degrading monooxygenase HmoA